MAPLRFSTLHARIHLRSGPTRTRVPGMRQGRARATVSWGSRTLHVTMLTTICIGERVCSSPTAKGQDPNLDRRRIPASHRRLTRARTCMGMLSASAHVPHTKRLQRSWLARMQVMPACVERNELSNACEADPDVSRLAGTIMGSFHSEGAERGRSVEIPTSVRRPGTRCARRRGARGRNATECIGGCAHGWCYIG